MRGLLRSRGPRRGREGPRRATRPGGPALPGLRLPEGHRDRRGARRPRPPARARAPHAGAATSSRSRGTRRSPRRRAACGRSARATAPTRSALYSGNPIVHNHGALLVRAGLLARRSAPATATAPARRTPARASRPRSTSTAARFAIADPRRRPHRLPALHRREPAGLERQLPDRARRARPAARAPRPRRQARRRRSAAHRDRAARPTSTSRSVPGGDAALLLAHGCTCCSTRAASTASAVARLARRLGRGRAPLRALRRPSASRPRRRRPAARRSRASRASSPARRRRRRTRASASATAASARSPPGRPTSSTSPPAGSARAGGAMFTTPAFDLGRLARLAGFDGHGRWRSRVRGLPETLGDLPAAALAEEIETPGAGPGARARSRSPAIRCSRCRTGGASTRALGQARLHGVDRPLRERDHAPRRRDPAAGWALAEDHVDLLFAAVVGAQRRALVAAASSSGRRASAPTGRSCSRSPSGSAAARRATRLASIALLRLAARARAALDAERVVDLLLRTRSVRRPLPARGRAGSTCAKLRGARRTASTSARSSPASRRRVLHRDRRVHLDAPPHPGAMACDSSARPRRAGAARGRARC